MQITRKSYDVNKIIIFRLILHSQPKTVFTLNSSPKCIYIYIEKRYIKISLVSLSDVFLIVRNVIAIESFLNPLFITNYFNFYLATIRYVAHEQRSRTAIWGYKRHRKTHAAIFLRVKKASRGFGTDKMFLPFFVRTQSSPSVFFSVFKHVRNSSKLTNINKTMSILTIFSPQWC